MGGYESVDTFGPAYGGKAFDCPALSRRPISLWHHSSSFCELTEAMCGQNNPQSVIPVDIPIDGFDTAKLSRHVTRLRYTVKVGRKDCHDRFNARKVSSAD